MNGETSPPVLGDAAIAPPTLEAPRLAMLIQALGRDRVATMLAMLRDEADPLCAAARGETPFPPRFADVEHVHALKGAAASLGANVLSAALAVLEHALRRGDVDATLSARAPLLAAAVATHAEIVADRW